MSSIKTSLVRTAAIAALVSSFAFAGSLHAALANTSDQTSQELSATTKSHRHDSPQAMAKRVEDRIATLHDKLYITSTQEDKWGDVAQAMRDNESTTSQLIQERQKNAVSMNAVDDLQSYENITQAHVDGLKKLIPAFQALYSDMSDDQKKKADKLFSSYEGHHGTLAQTHG